MFPFLKKCESFFYFRFIYRQTCTYDPPSRSINHFLYIVEFHRPIKNDFSFIPFFFSLPWNCLHLRLDVSSSDAFSVSGLFGRSHRILHLRLQSTRPVGSRLGMGRLLGQHSIRRQILSWICRRRRERPRHPLHDEPAQQRSRSSGKFENQILKRFLLLLLVFFKEVILMREHAQSYRLAGLRAYVILLATISSPTNK